MKCECGSDGNGIDGGVECGGKSTGECGCDVEKS